MENKPMEGTFNVKELRRDFTGKPQSVHYSKPMDEDKWISDSLDRSWENGRQYGITEAHLIVLNIANENPAITFSEFLKEFAKRLQEK